jgi:hypothetical protein
MKEMPKRVKRALRELAAEAHDLELRSALLPLAEVFEAWKLGKVSGDAVVEAIHAFHQGPARELYVKYERRYIYTSVARAIATGILSREKVPPDVLAHLARTIEVFADQEPQA